MRCSAELSNDRADRLAERGVSMNNSTFIVGLARCIGPLVKYFHASGNARALELAVCLKNKCVDEFFTAQGTYDRDTFGETHDHFVAVWAAFFQECQQ